MTTAVPVSMASVPHYAGLNLLCPSLLVSMSLWTLLQISSHAVIYFLFPFKKQSCVLFFPLYISQYCCPAGRFHSSHHTYNPPHPTLPPSVPLWDQASSQLDWQLHMWQWERRGVGGWEQGGWEVEISREIDAVAALLHVHGLKSWRPVWFSYLFDACLTC